MRWFNTAGPCRTDDHYTLLRRDGLPDLRPLIARQQYFGVHAPRQSGKTTAMRQLARDLTASGRYASLLVSFEVGQAFTHHLPDLEGALIDTLRTAADNDLPPELRPPRCPLRSSVIGWAAPSVPGVTPALVRSCC
jgi:hypothetical protein